MEILILYKSPFWSCISISKHYSKWLDDLVNRVGFLMIYRQESSFLLYSLQTGVMCIAWISLGFRNVWRLIYLICLPPPTPQRCLFPAFLFDSFPLPVKEVAWNSLQLGRHHYCPHLEHYLRLTYFFNGFPFRYSQFVLLKIK